MKTSMLMLFVLLFFCTLACARPMNVDPAGTSNSKKNCCKVCKKGQPCGASCISWRHTCHKETTCAC